MTDTAPSRKARLAFVTLAALAATLSPRSAAEASTDAAVELQAWAHGVAGPSLVATGDLAADAGPGVRRLAHLLRERLAASGDDLAPLDRDVRFWRAATESRDAAEFALAARVVLELCDRDVAGAAAHRPVWLHASMNPGPAAAVLEEAFTRIPAQQLARTGSIVGVADAALDRGDLALAAIAYRFVLLDLAPREYAHRDMAGHYFYCLDRLGASPELHSARARFNEQVVFPSVEAQMRARAASREERETSLSSADAR